MAKLKNVTVDELKAAEEMAFDASQQAAGLYNRGSQGYAETIPEPLSLASSFAAASRTLAELSAWLLAKAALQEQERVIKEQLGKRAAS